MKKIILIPASLSVGVFLLAALAFVIYHYVKSPSTVPGRTPISKIKMQMESAVKFIPEKGDYAYLEDDDVYTYYTFEHDSKGRTVRKLCYNVGPDKIKSADDTLKYYLDYEFTKDGKKLGKDICYNGPGTDNQWFTQDDVEIYRSVYGYGSGGNRQKVIRYAPDANITDYTVFETIPGNLIIKDVIFKGKGPDNEWQTHDDEIEKYHRYEYDGKGKLLRAMEYLAKKNGKGTDDVWFSADDVISSTKVFTYSSTGLLIDIKKYIDPGPDNKWFTQDDIPQYYTVYHYTEGVYH